MKGFKKMFQVSYNIFLRVLNIDKKVQNMK